MFSESNPMSRILFILCCVISWPGLAQNAFFDAQKIPGLLRSNQTERVIQLLMNCAKEGQAFPWARLSRKYPDHVKALLDNNESFRLNNFYKLLKDEPTMRSRLDGFMAPSSELNAFKEAVEWYYEVLTEVKERNQLQQELDSLQESGTLRPEIRQAAMFKKYHLDTIQDQSGWRQSLDSLHVSASVRDSIQSLLDLKRLRRVSDSNAVRLHARIEDLDVQRDRLASMFMERTVFNAFFPPAEYETQMTLWTTMAGQTEQFRMQADQMRTEILMAAPPAAFKLPGQSEMIDALAIYLARRVKQEVAIAFIEQLTKYIRDQALINQLFPSTLQLLNNREAYMRPNFGTSWQIALSDDFIHIPENLPKCLPSRYKMVASYLEDGIRIARLASQHYSFTEAVNLLYDEPMQSDILRHSNSLIYIINHEFFEEEKEKGKRYWISVEKLQSLNKEQLEWLYILLDIRYGETLNLVLSQTWKGREIWKEEYFATKVYPFRNWIGSILVQLNDFEKNLSGLKQTATPDAASVLQGFWKFQCDLMDAVLNQDFVHLPPKAMRGVQFTRSVFSMYSGIEQKNYARVVDEVLKVFSLLELDQHVGIQDLLTNQEFRDALLEKDIRVQDRVTELFARLDQNYEQLSTIRLLVRIPATYLQIREVLKSRDRQSELSYQADPEKWLNALLDLAGKNERSDVLKFLLSETILNELKNDASRNKELHNLTLAVQLQYDSLVMLHRQAKQAMFILDTLRSELDKNDLLKDKYAAIQTSNWKEFAREKLFSFAAPLYRTYLSGIGQRRHDQKIRTALSFLSDVMQSGNSQALSKVVEAYSLPPSSYKIKRHSRFSVHLDAMVGGYAGIEAMPNEMNSIEWKAVTGLSAPIGISLSWGKRFKLNKQKYRSGDMAYLNRHGQLKRLKGSNSTILFSVIDIGAAVSYRITNQQEEGLPTKARWSQVFSPGISFLHGFRGLPLCIGAGFRFTPNLRTLNGTMQRNAFRADIGLYFDLPMFNIFYH